MLVTKKSAKKIRAFLGWVVFLLFFTIVPVQAQGDLGFGSASNIGGGAFGTNDLTEVIINVINIALGFLGILVVIIIMYGGWLWMTSGGNPERVDKAKKVLRNGVIGLAIILASWSIAWFIFKVLTDSTTSGSGPPPGVIIGNGALGAGIIESVYPPPGANGIPRNTKIFVTFKEPMNTASIIAGGAVGTLVETGIPLTPVVRIMGRGDAAPWAGADVSATTNPPSNRTFVFDPSGLLGSANSDTYYTVGLTGYIEKADSSGAFGAISGSVAFQWSFTVSNLVDVTPPKIISVNPVPNSDNPRNVIINIKFNEPINPVTVDPANIVVSYGGGFISGTLFQSGDYKTVEFLPETECEGHPLNTCGDPIYCLPASAIITTFIQADDTDSIPIDGIQDAADNSLDGNKNGVACGRNPASNELWDGNSCTGSDDLNYNLDNSDPNDGDNAEWQFTTNDTIDIWPPRVAERDPDNGAGSISLTNPLMVKMDKYLRITSLRPDNSYADGREYVTLIDPRKEIGYWIGGTNGNGCSVFCLNEGSSSAFGSVCGNGVQDTGEDCDDANTRSGDGCSSDCLNEGTGRCGDGFITHAEECDDDDIASGDGCDSDCLLEGSLNGQCGSILDIDCCGNGSDPLEPGEACDDINDPGCDPSTCLRDGDPGGSCGDNIIQPELGENCDDGNIITGDGCSNVCRKEGSACGINANSIDGLPGNQDPGEDCDGGAGCSNNCLNMGTVLPGICGDGAPSPPVMGVPGPGEDCDLGPVLNEAYIFIDHTIFGKNYDYGLSLSTGIRDSYQNCFLPCGTGDNPPTGECPIQEDLLSPIGFGPVTPPWDIPPIGDFPSCISP